MSRRATAVAAVLLLLTPLLGAPPAQARPRYLDDVALHPGQPGYDAEVVTTPRGVTLAVWASGSFGSRELTYAVHRPGRAWTMARPVADAHVDLTTSSPYFDVAMDRRGAVTVIWTRAGGASGVVATSSWTDRTGWTDPRDLSVDGSFAQYVDLDVDDAGNLTATWSETLLTTRFKPYGRAWRAPVRVPSSVPSQEISVATDATGRQVMTWLQFDGTGDPDVHQIRAATRRNGTAAWSGPVGLTAPEQDVVLTEVIRVPGGVLALWRNDESGRLETALKPSGASWGTVRPIGNQPAGFYVDSDDRHRVTLVFEKSDGASASLVGRQYVGGRWLPREVIATDVGAFRSALDVSRSGRAGVQFRTGGDRVWTSTLLASGWGEPHELGISELGQIQADGLGVDEQGNLVALWNKAVQTDLTASVLDAGRPVTRITKLAFTRRTGKLFVRWSASDRWSPITAVTIELRFAKPGGGFSPWRSWPRPYTLASHSATATVAKDKRWCVHVRTTDGTGSASRFVTKCTPARR